MIKDLRDQWRRGKRRKGTKEGLGKKEMGKRKLGWMERWKDGKMEGFKGEEAILDKVRNIKGNHRFL